MDTQTSKLVALWEESRTRLEKIVNTITTNDLRKTLAPSPNSIGFLLQHIAEVELLFAKNVFDAKDTKVIAKTIIAQHDTGEWTDLESIISNLDRSRKSLQAIISQQRDSDWDDDVITKEFGTRTKTQALGRITSHTAYHAGQVKIILKYGSDNS
ncbi:DinB family protein [Dokdonia sinensis]|uniref:DinB family protein n=1 Tax=Dokdonia sinensis TaxID=2479847 RepID=A0A3M0H363_9FLAO|nr:DinB family protein [Dokdonia sinensis]RMB64116.1 DinB family protein [Dokdonia sinensis]